MAHSQIQVQYVSLAGGMTAAQLTTLLSNVGLRYSQPRTVGLLPKSDATAAVGSVVTRKITLGMGSLYTQTTNFTLNGQPASPIVNVGLSGGVHSDYASPPIVSFSDPAPAASGAKAVARMGLGTAFIFNGGTGYGALTTTVVAKNGQLDPNGSAAVLAPIVGGGGVITGINVVSPGSGYNRFATLVFTDTGGGSGAVGVIALKPVLIKLISGGNGYTAPTMTLTPPFIERCPDSSGSSVQASMIVGWMLAVLAQQTGLAVQELAPVVS